jgi:hypothetical protein
MEHGEFSRRLFNPCAFLPTQFRADFALPGAKALIILAGVGTTEVVP